MAAREPLLGALKGAVLRLRADGAPCTDASPQLAAVCALLERALGKGLRQPLWGFGRRDFWHCVEQLPRGESGSIVSDAAHGSIWTLAVSLRDHNCLCPSPHAEPFISLVLVLTEVDFSLDLQAGTMLQKLKGQPLSLRVLRWQGHNGEVYEPLLPYLETVKEKEPHFQLQRSPRRWDEGEKQRVQRGRLLYRLQYLGRIGVGMFGGKEVLQKAIPTVLESCSAPREVLFDVKETEILVQEKASPEVLFHHPYPAVSCVGRCLQTSNVFAFCVA
ncbi:hypothetical protein ASZ78_013694 [Callipepla squamata]|uniref:RUN domain-containing protein n=1 Tax=Callipepla squamata TaxID=9009 RepID=A0A226N0S0_CALSU|nr:hypothetical protein ASZ78_013694 [Callipepla squamata]